MTTSTLRNALAFVAGMLCVATRVDFGPPLAPFTSADSCDSGAQPQCRGRPAEEFHESAAHPLGIAKAAG